MLNETCERIYKFNEDLRDDNIFDKKDLEMGYLSTSALERTIQKRFDKIIEVEVIDR